MRTKAQSREKVRCRANGALYLGLVLSALFAWKVAAADSGSGNAPAGGSPLNAFFGQLGEEQKARVASIVRAASTNAQAQQTALMEALLALSPDLVRALGALNAERTAEALTMLEPLTRSPDPFLAKHAAWFRIRALIGAERYEEALATLPSVQTNAAQHTYLAGEMLYTEGLLHAYLLDRAAAAATLQRYLERFPDAPAEDRGAAQGMLDEIARTKPESLLEVATLMNESRRRLHLDDSGDLTQSRQRQIVQVLDKLIAELEKKQRGGGSDSGSDSGSGSGQGGVSGGRGGGAKESSLAGGASGTNLERPADGGNPDEWAKAYSRDREAVKRELQTRLPERYRELIEQYYRSLSTEGKTGGE